ncbi:reverse transcriptase domain-containing protein [Tanacetum coccineum]
MAKEDEEKTSFITSQGIFCYTKMPFGLRNARATYQRLVDKAFHKQIGRNLEVYVDDLVIKSRMEDEIVRDIEETFKTLREINMKLNLKSVPLGFLAKSAEKSLLFFKTLKKCTKKSDFHWTAKAEEVFKQMKQLIAELPMLAAPMEKEELIVYLAAAKETVLSRPEVAGRLQKWSIKLGEYVIHYRPRVSVKGQILADFIVERPEEDSPNTLMEVEEELPEPFDAINNEAKYEALIARLSIAEQMGVKNLQANVDSRLVANQVNRTYIAKEADMVRYLEKVRTLTSCFKEFSIRQVPISENKKADALSKITSTSFAHLSKQVLVEELKEKLISEAEILAAVEEEGDTWMTPIFEYLIEETLPVDVKKARAVRRKSQRFAVINETLYKKSFLEPWLRCVGLLQANYVLREIHEGSCSMHADTQSVVAKALRFGLPGKIISDNGKQFWDNPFKDWCEKLCIRQHFASVKHPQTNGLVERANRSLGEGIKASNGDTPFSLTYGTEAVISAKIGMPTLRTTKVDLAQNNEALEINLDLLEEKREQAAIREAKSKAKMEKYYNSKVRSISFKPGDLVYRNNDARLAEDTGKLGPKWEGPYEITKALGKGVYKLRDRDRKQLPRT